MLMKRLILVIGAALAFAVACDRDSCALCPDAAELRHVRLALTGSGVQTRALNVTDAQEAAVTGCTLFVFSRDGRMVSSYTSGSGVFDFYLTDETYDFAAVVNMPQLPDSPTREELFALKTHLADNAVGQFVMVGSLPNHVIQADEKITVGVKRIVSKVSYKIRTAFTGTLATKSFAIEEIYLTNVAGDNNLSLTGAPESSGVWYNPMNRTAASGDSIDDLLYGRLSVPMTPVDSIWSGHTFYAYPNASPDNHDKDTWSARCTRFVVKATLDGKTTYYPVTLPVTESNKHYHVDLTISNFGVEHPEDIPQKNEYVDAAVSVTEWEDGGTIHADY